MINMLAHRLDGTEAIIQLENGQPYHYKFGAVDTYELITDLDKTVSPETWETSYPYGNEFDTMNHVKRYLQGYVAGLEPVR